MAKHRVCVIGNSHAAALRIGMEKLAALNENFEFDFFAAQSDLMRDMTAQGKRLVPTTEVTKNRLSAYSQGASEIDTANYDSFLLVGLGVNIAGPGLNNTFGTIQGNRIYGFDYAPVEAATYISRACFKAATTSVLRGSTAYILAKQLKLMTGAPVFLMPAPYPSETILNDKQGKLWRKSVASGVWAFASEAFQAGVVSIAREVDCHPLFQSRQTMTEELFTKAEYAHGSARLSKDMAEQHPPNEPFHMNGLYGAERLEEFIQALSKSSM